MKFKKRFYIYFICILFIVGMISSYIKLQPLIDIQIKAHFHEKVIQEIMNSVNQIEIPKDFIIRNNQNMSIDTNLLNEWIIEVNQTLNQTIEDKIETSMPLGYLTGIVYIQDIGPDISASFVVVNRITAQYDIKTTSLGINNVLIELILNIHCKGNIYLGFKSNELIVQEKIPLALEYIQGNIPSIIPY